MTQAKLCFISFIYSSILLLWFSVNSDVSLQKRIIGGQNCDDTKRLYHVRLESSNDTHITRCGGSLIHPQWILTSAHCWKAETNVAVLKVHPRTAGEQRQIIRQAPVIYSHNFQHHDIMLLKLETPVTDVPLPRLPDRRGSVVQLAGEGTTTTGPNNQRCERNIEVMRIKSLFLSLQRGLTAMLSDMIYGVISFGGAYYACQRPATILDVCEYKDWIKSITGRQ
uniref:Peptidase S1 domain-containing protein n=1 Tax=Xiphophorus maculatus TaxID=8083 RepID=A0A3B5QJU7_XIPMA